MSDGSSIGNEENRLLCPPKPIMRPRQVDRPQHEQEQIAHLERLCGQQAPELDLIRLKVGVLKKEWH